MRRAGAVVAGLIQGTISGCITLVLKRGIEFLAGRFRGVAAVVAPPLIAGALSASVLTVLHLIGGTPEIAHTIALPLAVTITYATLYNLSLWRARR